MRRSGHLLDRLRSHAEARPDAILFAGAEPMTRRQAVERAELAASSMRTSAEGRPILLPAAGSANFLIALLAAEASGNLAVVLPSAVAADAAEAVEVLGPALLWDLAAAAGVRLGGGPAAPLPAGAALCLPTSGSSGRPRWALRSAHSLLEEGERYHSLLALDDSDLVLSPLPLAHAFALGLAVGACLSSGAALRLMESFLPGALERALLDEPVTVLALVPAAARLLCRGWRSPERPAALRHVVVGAGSLAPGVDDELARILGRRAARNYGSTETGATLGTAGEEVDAEVTGRPLRGVEVQVQAHAPSASGALFVRVDTPFLGYVTEQGFDASRISPDGWFSTGDLAQSGADGWLRVRGRLDRVVRRGGRSIEPAEVEAVLRRHPAVSDVVVVGVPDSHGEQAISAHVELTAPGAADVAGLRAHVEALLPTWKVPTRWRFHRKLPRTAGGKPDLLRVQRLGRGWLEPLAAHRLGSTVAAAVRLGLVERLAEAPATAGEAAEHLDLPTAGVEMLLEILAAAGLVAEDGDGRYEPTSAPPLYLRDLVDLEEALKHRLLTPEAIRRSVLGEVAPAASAAQANGFLPVYRRLMGASGRLAALRAHRFPMPAGPVLDVGHPAGSFAQRASGAGRESVIHEVTFGSSPPFSAGPDLAAIFVHNAFRSLVAERGPQALAELVMLLAPGGWLFISDIFTDAPGSATGLKSSLLVDWACLGSSRIATGRELCQEFINLGLERIERLASDEMFELVAARRPLPREVQ